MKASDIGLLNEELKANTSLTELNLESEDEKEKETEKERTMNDRQLDWSRRSKGNE